MSCSSPALSSSLTISVIDITEYGLDYGLLSATPTSPVPVYEADRPTDHYTDISSGITYECRSSGWEESDNASYLVNCLKSLVEATPSIDLASISNANTESFFAKIIAQKIYAEPSSLAPSRLRSRTTLLPRPRHWRWEARRTGTGIHAYWAIENVIYSLGMIDFSLRAFPSREAKLMNNEILSEPSAMDLPRRT